MGGGEHEHVPPGPPLATPMMVMSERDELGPSAPKAFNQTEELFYVELKMYSRHLLTTYLQRLNARRNFSSSET